MVPAPNRLHAASRYIAFLMLVFALLVSAAFANKKEVEAADLIEQAKKLSDIRAEGAPAFRLRLIFRIIKEDGTVRDGTYNETWDSKAQWRRVTASDDFRRVEVASGKKLWRFDSTTAVLEHLHDVLAFSLPTGGLHPEAWKPGEIKDHEIRGRRVRCIETNPDPPGASSALCFDKNDGTLAAQAWPLRVGTRIADKDCIFSDYQSFGNRLVAKSYKCYEDGHLRLEAKIVEIVADSEPDPALFVPPDGAKESVNCLGSVKSGMLVDRVAPRYPLAGCGKIDL